MVRQRMTQYSIPIKNEPGTLFRVAQTLAKEGVNITGFMVDTQQDLAFVRFVSDKENGVIRRPLEHAGYEVFEREVFQLELPNQPGELSRLAKCLAEEDINVLGGYGTTDGAENAKLIVSVDQPEKAQSVLSKLTEKAHVTA